MASTSTFATPSSFDKRFESLTSWMLVNGEEHWILNLLRNILSYSTLVLPFYLLYLLAKARGLLAKAESAVESGDVERERWVVRLVAFCLVKKPKDAALPTASRAEKLPAPKGWLSRHRDTAMLLFCFLGLMTMYLTWGVLQEKMMTQEYHRIDTIHAPPQRFKDSQFLVFVNRASALVLALVLISINDFPSLRAPLYQFSYASLSNIMSSWFQYEALKHIIFPVQVLGKSFKIVPVMLMSKLISGATYPRHEYFTSLLISAGCGLFLYSQGSRGSKKLGESMDLSGLIIMGGYIAFDSFTSNWQAELKRKYEVHKIQLMCGVNLFSTALTLFSCLVQGTFFSSLTFVFTHQGPIYTNQTESKRGMLVTKMVGGMIWDVVLLATCGAIGQLFIFETITRFGAVVFTIMMTIRQAAAIFLSCLWYGHELNSSGVFGVLLVTGAILLKPYLSRKSKAAKSVKPPLGPQV